MIESRLSENFPSPQPTYNLQLTPYTYTYTYTLQHPNYIPQLTKVLMSITDKELDILSSKAIGAKATAYCTSPPSA